jgi:hypothetical protein
MKMALKIGGTTVVDNDKKLTEITGIDATTKTSLEAALTNIDADTLDGQQGSYYTTYTDNAIADLVDSSPAALDTLNELAAALGDDPNFATTVSAQIGTKANSSITISAGDGLTGGGNLTASRTISHGDTSSQASVNNSNGTVIQDVTLDGYGHVTGLTSVNLDGRYYTETESDSRFTDTYASNYTYKSAGDLGYTNSSSSGRFAHLRGGLGSGPFTYAEAIAHAASVGARLPTVEELEDEIVKGTGGGYDSYQCWTCTAVPGQPGYVYTKLGTGAGTRNPTPTDGSETAYTRYVATVNTPSVFTDNYHPNADELTTARNIALTGAVTGNANFDGSGDISIATTHTADPTITLTGAVTGSGTMTNLGNVSITTTATADPTLTIEGDASGSATFTNLGNATLSLTVANDSHTHDGRYYTKTEADSRFVNVTGDTMSGDLNISKADAKIRLYDSTGTSGNNPFVEWDTTANQGIKMELNVYDGELPEAGYGLVVGPSTTNAQWPDTGNLSFNVLGEIYAGSETLSTVNKVFHDSYHPNADKWTTARTLSLGGDVSGSVSLDGSSDVTITATVANDSHTHNYVIAIDDRDMKPNTSGVQSPKAMRAFFSSKGGMTGTADTNYHDVLVLDTYSDASGGGPNAITFDKGNSAGDPEAYLWHGNWGGTTWGTGQRIFADNYHPNADKWTTARTLSLTGAVTGSASIDGSGNVSLATTATSDPELTITGDASGSATFTNLGNATLNLTIDDFQRISDKEFFSITNTGTTSGVWTGTHPDITSYFDGMTIAFYQNNVAGASTTTLNINNLGAKTLYYANNSKLTTHYGPRALIMLQYDAEQDRFYAHDFYFSSTDYELRWQTDVQAGTYIHGYQLLLEGVDGKYYPVTEGGSTGNTNTVSTAEIRVGGNMIKYNASTDYAADSIITSNTLYTSLQTGNMEYWNNRDPGWATPYTPIYLVGTINSNGNFVLDNSSYTSFLTQDLPTTEDGKVYWYIGLMTDNYDDYRLIANHPMYIYKNGAIREWGQYASNSDKLDGQDGSYYYPASNPNGYTTNVGDITGVTAGSGISGGGTSGTVTISHADTSSQASVNNSNGTVIQDVILDTYGHVTSLTSINLDSRYYTESEANSRFVNVTGDTMTGDLTMDGAIVKSVVNTVTASTAGTSIDFAQSNFHVVNLNANTTFTFSNLGLAVTSSGTIIVKQNSTGGKSFTLPSVAKTPVGGASIVQVTGANTTSILSYLVVSSTEVLVNYIGDFA